MTPEEFQQRIHEMRKQFGDLFDRYGLPFIPLNPRSSKTYWHIFCIIAAGFQINRTMLLGCIIGFIVLWKAACWFAKCDDRK